MASVAVIGGGQLARMMAAPAVAMGLDLRVLVESADAAAAAAVADSRLGRASDAGAVADLVTRPTQVDVLTFEHEHVPAAVLTALGDVSVQPPASALRFAQDKIAMREAMTRLGVPSPAWAPVTSAADLDAFLTGRERVVVKTARGGYDGKGVRVVSSPGEVSDWLAAAAAGDGPELLAEELVPFDCEVAALLARSPSGEIRQWDLAQTIQTGGVCSVVIAPAPVSEAARSRAQAAAAVIAEGLAVTGVLAVEMFVVGDEVLVNELAMRPHNSGHWTIDAAVTSQFEQHLRAVLDLPLGSVTMTAHVAVMANVLGSALPALTDALPAVMAADPAAKVQLYGKGIRPGRKLGHVTCTGTDVDAVRARAEAAARLIEGVGL